MVGEDELPNVAAALNEAALQPEGWPTALSQIGGLVGSTWSLLGVLGRDGQEPFVAQDPAGDTDHLTLFTNRYNRAETNASIPAMLAAGPGAIIVREQIMTDAAWLRCDLYRDVYRPKGLYHGLGAFVLNSRSHVSLLGLNRPRPRGPFTERDLDLLRQTLPHLERALQVFLKLAEADTRQRAHEAAWDTLACGVILLDDAGSVLWTNRAATATLACMDGLSIRNGSLAAASPRENGALQLLVRQAIGTSRGRCLAPGGSLSVSRHSPVRSLALLISPIHLERSLVRRPAAVVFLSDPEREPELAPQLLKRLYGLTNREAALAALLVRGANLHDAAEELAVSVHTARTFLRFIFRKTATRRQSELVALVLRSPFGLR